MTITDAKERILYFTIETQYLSLILSVFLTIPQSQTLRIIFQKLKMPITKTTSLCFKLYLKRQFNLFSTSSNSFPLMSKKMKRNSNKLYSKKSESMFTESQWFETGLLWVLKTFELWQIMSMRSLMNGSFKILSIKTSLWSKWDSQSEIAFRHLQKDCRLWNLNPSIFLLMMISTL